MTELDGFVRGLDETEYHAHPALSASAAKVLLRSPARFQYQRTHAGRAGTPAMDFGTLVHALTLRSHDSRIAVLPYADWRTKDAQTQRDALVAAGRIPMLAKDVRRAIAVAKAVHAHPLAGPILSEGQAEVSMFWDDPDTGVRLRGRIDWLRDNALIDLKTTSNEGAELDTFGRQAARLDYPMSAAHYVAGVAAITGRTLPFITITVEVEEPHWITVAQYAEVDLAAGYDRMRAAIDEYARRTESGVWDDPIDAIPYIPVPEWYARHAAHLKEF